MSTRRPKQNEMKATLQEEQSKLVQMEKVLLGMIHAIDTAQNDLLIEEFQIKAKLVPEVVTKTESK